MRLAILIGYALLTLAGVAFVVFVIGEVFGTKGYYAIAAIFGVMVFGAIHGWLNPQPIRPRKR